MMSLKLALVILSVLLLLPYRGESLGFTSPRSLGAARFGVRRPPSGVTPLRMGWFDFNPMRGSGSGGNKDFLDEQFEAQQEILRARQQAGLTKDSLKKKYEERVSVSNEKAPVKESPTEETSEKGIKLPWEK